MLNKIIKVLIIIGLSGYLLLHGIAILLILFNH